MEKKVKVIILEYIMVKKNNQKKSIISEEDLLNFVDENKISIRDYVVTLRVNSPKIIGITLLTLLLAGIYAWKTPDIYKATTMLKLSKPPNDILEAPLLSQLSDSKSLFVLNELEILQSYTIREQVAKALIDTFHNKRSNIFPLISDRKTQKNLPIFEIVKILDKKVKVEQKDDLEIVNISAESPSPYEAATIANIYAEIYHEMNLSYNRSQMTKVREFLEKQSQEKHDKLIEAENKLKTYQEKGGIIALDDQSKALIDQLTDFEAKKNVAKIELLMAEKAYTEYKKELQKEEPKITDYMEKYAIEPYLEELQKEIARYEVKKDMTIGNDLGNKVDTDLIKGYNAKIAELKAKRDKKLVIFKAGMLASSSEEVKLLVQKVLDQEVKYHSLIASFEELCSIVNQYENKFSQLPKRTIDLARLEREKGESEKLFLLVQEKYQEAMINEQSTPGNDIVIDRARYEIEPYKPNRVLIIILGLLVGLGMGTGIVLISNYFDNTIKTPEDLEKLNINLLGWIPSIEHSPKELANEYEFIVAKRPNSIPSEAYRALRTRIQFSKVSKEAIKVILVTSSSPQEGKTVTSANLAASFAITGKKTLLIDGDLRKPRLHKLFNAQKSPGFTDYIFENAKLDEIVRESEVPKLYYISSGIIPPNPAEILGSNEMVEMLDRLKEIYEIIIIDSPPILAVTDAEILSCIADVSILIASANKTELETIKKSVDMLMYGQGSFIGVILNNFIYKNGYGNYYKNYYYYQRTADKKPTQFKKIWNSSKIKIQKS